MKRGFTLIELIVVISVLIILAAILIPTVFGFISRANEAADLANARMLYSAALISITNADVDITGTYTANATGQTPTLFADYVGTIWPVPRAAGSLYFETVIAEENGISVIEIHRIKTSGEEVYNNNANGFQ